MKIYIVIPAYNEAKRISSVLSQLKKTNLPVIVVDDGSSDKTLETIRSYGVTILHHRVNLGKGAGLKTGCLAAFKQGADAVIMMDADGQHQVADLPKFIGKLQENYQIVFGSRNYNMNVPLIRFLGNKLASVMISLLFGIYVSDLICGFRALTKEAFGKVIWDSQGYGVETEMVVRTSWAKMSKCEVPVETIYYDKFKGVTILDALGILASVLKWRISK